MYRVGTRTELCGTISDPNGSGRTLPTLALSVPWDKYEFNQDNQDLEPQLFSKCFVKQTAKLI